MLVLGLGYNDDFGHVYDAILLVFSMIFVRCPFGMISHFFLLYWLSILEF